MERQLLLEDPRSGHFLQPLHREAGTDCPVPRGSGPSRSVVTEANALLPVLLQGETFPLRS